MAGWGGGAAAPGLLPQRDGPAWCPQWEVGARFRQARLQARSCRHSAEAWGARRRRLWAPRNGARSSPGGLGSAGVQLTSAQEGGLWDRSPLGGRFGLCPREKVRKECVHPAASRALLPRCPAPAWSPLEAARDQGPRGPRLPHGLHAAVVSAPSGRRETTLPAQRALPRVAVTWLGPTPSGGDRDKPVSRDSVFGRERVTCQRRVSSEACRAQDWVPLNSHVEALTTHVALNSTHLESQYSRDKSW